MGLTDVTSDKIVLGFKYIFSISVESIKFVRPYVRKFLLFRGNVISWLSYAMSPGKINLAWIIYKLRKELSF